MVVAAVPGLALIEEFGRATSHLGCGHVLDALAEHPLLTERVTQPAGTFPVELI
jgi:hypothetical protein